MSFILNIETATKNCSVSLGKNGQTLACIEYAGEGYSHAEKLHLFIQQIIKDNNLSFNDLSAIAVSMGPGSYTGLRIGVSAAKGLAYSLDIPLIAVSTLSSLAYQIQEKDVFIIPMIDARRKEVYAAVYDDKHRMIREVQADILDVNAYKTYLEQKKVIFVGDAVPKTKEIIQHQNAVFSEVQYPSARQMSYLSFQKYNLQQFENVAYFEPYYLKDFIITRKE